MLAFTVCGAAHGGGGDRRGHDPCSEPAVGRGQRIAPGLTAEAEVIVGAIGYVREDLK